jgi:hypothetical protein
MSGIIILDRDNQDITMDEQSSMYFNVNTTNPDETPLDLTNATVYWVADFHGVQQVKKDTLTMMAMLGTAPTTTITTGATVGTKKVTLAQVAGFAARPNDGVPTADFVAGNDVIITSGGTSEVNTIASIATGGNSGTKVVTLVNNLARTYASGSTFKTTIYNFTFSLLPGDTILPTTATYGTPIVYNHQVMVTYPAGLSPGNIYAAETTLFPIKGRMFVNPILPMD